MAKECPALKFLNASVRLDTKTAKDKVIKSGGEPYVALTPSLPLSCPDCDFSAQLYTAITIALGGANIAADLSEIKGTPCAEISIDKTGGPNLRPLVGKLVQQNFNS